MVDTVLNSKFRFIMYQLSELKWRDNHASALKCLFSPDLPYLLFKIIPEKEQQKYISITHSRNNFNLKHKFIIFIYWHQSSLQKIQHNKIDRSRNEKWFIFSGGIIKLTMFLMLCLLWLPSKSFFFQSYWYRSINLYLRDFQIF